MIRVGINVTRPRSIGRKVLLGKDCEVWVTFKYEKMPSFCYWCGLVSHDAKECSFWLSSKGSLSLDQQWYSAWLRADPFSARKKSFVFVPSIGRDFGGEDNPVRNESGLERRPQGAKAPQTVAASPIDPNPSNDIQNSATLDNQATISPTSHLGNDEDGPESFLIVMPVNTHTNMVNFEAQIQDIDMELNRYDSHESLVANPEFQEDASPSLSNCVDQVFTCDINAPLLHNDAHVSNKNPRDLEGNQSCLRTWKRMARLNQNGEPAMHAPSLGKRTPKEKGNEEIE